MEDKHPMNRPDGSVNPDPNDLIRYAAGEMSDEEAHRFEAHSMDDPFLNDALEGLSASDRARMEQMAYGLNQDLKRRLSDRRKKRWIGYEIPSWWPWLTLIFLLLIALSYLFIRKLSG
jgi:anti-sigma factor RsiW